MTTRVMVIDDDRGIRSFLQKSLTAKGYEVEVAERGATGLQRLLAEEFELVFLDLNMPEISGQAICSALRRQEKTCELPVVMMTAMFQTPQQMEKMKSEYGASAFLLKPFSVADLFAVVDALLGAETQPEAEEKSSQPNDNQSGEAPEQAAVEPISGRLDKTPFPLLLHKLYQQKVTGLLHVQKKAAKKVVYIKNGYPIFARSNILGECLGRMLVKEDVITQVDCDQSIENSKTSGRLQGTVLIEMGLLTPQDLHGVLKRQVVEKLLNIFSWPEGQFRFVPQADFKKNVTNIELSPSALILE